MFSIKNKLFINLDFFNLDGIRIRPINPSLFLLRHKWKITAVTFFMLFVIISFVVNCDIKMLRYWKNCDFKNIATWRLLFSITVMILKIIVIILEIGCHFKNTSSFKKKICSRKILFRYDHETVTWQTNIMVFSVDRDGDHNYDFHPCAQIRTPSMHAHLRWTICGTFWGYADLGEVWDQNIWMKLAYMQIFKSVELF